MTAHYLQAFGDAHPCQKCGRDAGRRLLCRSHLAQAREEWAAWAAERRRYGTCCWCERKSFRGTLRCRAHAAENRVRSAEWRAAHPDARRALKLAWRAKGRCDSCVEHRRLYSHHPQCAPCRKRLNAASNWYYHHRRGRR